MTAYTVEIIMALQKGERVTRAWWDRRYAAGARRAGGMPAEIPPPGAADLTRETDPDTGDRYARASIPLPDGTSLGRARELAHTLTSVLVSEGYTLRADGKREDHIPGEDDGPSEGEFGGTDYTTARVCSGKCMACIFAGDARWGCCGEGCAWSLADIGAVLLAGNDELIANVLAQPGEMDGVKWHPNLKGGICVYHDPSRGCTLPPAHMPLQCRTYLCAPERLLPPDLLADYAGFVDGLEEQEAFVEDHMRLESDVDFGSSLDELRAAAARAFAAWAAGQK
ncbi:MAG TPA: hypothetical protein VD969_01155 [Symbiobacteriaceae bacterium]|nr:hypothetical protein [Symbiobacteriaceae bacterium]